MNKEIQVRIILRHNTTKGWEVVKNSEVLFKGEIGLEFVSGSNIPKMKIGDGTTPWSRLKYYIPEIPEKYTWNDLMGTKLTSIAEETKNLNLKKPAYYDQVDLKILNENYDKLDDYYNLQQDIIQNFQNSLDNLTLLLKENPSEFSQLEGEIILARTINEKTYNSLSEALNALNIDLQNYKIKLEEIIANKIPIGLVVTEDGKLFLSDSKGGKIGEEVTVIDNELRTEVEGIRTRSDLTVYETAGEAVRAIDTDLQILNNKVKNNIIEINDLKDSIEKLPSTFPDNLIYEENKLYLAVGEEKIEESMVEIVGGGGGGLDTSYKIELTSDERNISKPLGEEVVLTYTYLSYDREDNTINDGPGSGELLINNIQRATFRVVQGKNTLDVTKYLAAGSNTLKIKVTNSEGSSKVIQFNITLLSLTISSNFPTLSYQESGILPISYTVTSEVEFISHFMLTKQNAPIGDPYYEAKEIFTETFNRGTTSTAYLSPLSSGSYTLEVYATSGEITSNSLFFGLISYTSTDGNPFIVILPEKKTFSQGETISLSYLVYHPNNTSPSVTFTIYSLNENNEKVEFSKEVIENVGRTPREITAQRYPVGKIILELSCGGVSNSVELLVEESEIELELFREDLVFEFDPVGRTNQNSANNWSYTDKDGKTYIAEFEGIDWGELDGWQIKKDEEGKLLEDQTMLRILPGGSVTIPFKPFENEIVNNNVGYTIELELATQNVTNYESLIIDIFDESEDSQRGLRVYSQSAELKSRANSISAQFREDDRIRLTFTIEPSTLNKLIMIYINGVLCGIKQYDEDAFLNGSPIIVGAEDNGVDLYFIRAYKRVLDEYQQLNNFCVDRPSFTEKVSAKTRNDILNASAGGDLAKMITIDSLKGSVPYIIMHCPRLPANKEQDKFKNMKMTFVDPANPSRSFTAEGCTFSVQGTSSAGYPVKNFKIKLDKEKGIVYIRNGQTDLDGFYFKGKEKSQPTKVFCLKADYASSENANNVMLVDYYNQTCPYRNEAQKYQTDNGQPETVRHGIHGEPIVLFWQEIDPVTGEGSGEIYFQGKYNFNDDKDSENVFGYIGVLPEDIFNIQCWEFRNNNMDLCLFKHNLTEGNNAWFKEVEDDKGKMVPAWSNSFERRFPEQEDDVVPDLTAFRRMVDWVASTNTIDVYNTELNTPIYYRTLDKKYDDKKTYYQKNEDGSFSLFEIIVEDATFSYSSAVRINNLIMIPKIQSLLETETRPIDLIFSKKENSNWRLYYIDNEIEIELAEDISNLTEYGIVFDTSSNLDIDSLESFSIQFYKSNNWTSQLYEYHTHDTSSYRLAKFKNEFEDYFILDAMAYYYVFTETVLLMDNRAKNMFLVCYDVDSKLIYDEDGKVIGSEKQPTGTYGHWAPTPYDMDSALGINNEGELVYSYHLEDDGRDGQVFTGQASVLWNNFRDCFQDKIAEKYLEIRGQHGTTNGSMPFSYETLSEKMNNHQDAWPEIIWNIDQQIKYLQPFYNSKGDIDHLAMAQGDKRSQRNFWLYNAFKYRDSKYSAGDALSNYILFRLNGPGEFNIVPYSNIYARVRFGNALDLKERALKNTTTTFSTEGISSIYDLETYVYSADRISSIGDLSDFNIGLCNFASASKLKEIILGSEREGYQNEHLKNFRAGASTVLQEVNLSNCINLAMGINLEQCPNLQIFKAAGSAITGVTFARGARLSTCKLPKSMTYLSLLDLKYLNEEGLYAETKENGKYAFTGIRIENCPNLPFYDLIMNSDNLNYLTLKGLNWETSLSEFTTFFNKVKTLKGLDENGAEMPNLNAQISGKVYLTESITSELLEEINALFPELVIVVNGAPQYFLTFKDYKNETICRYIASENSTPLDPTKDEIPGLDKTPAEILALLNEKPGEDNDKGEENPEGEIDTRFIFDSWIDFPEKVTSSAIFIPNYKTEYLVKFFNEEKTSLAAPSIWVEKGTNASDPREEGYILTKTPTAEFSYNHSGWNKSLANIQQPTNFLPIFTEERNSYRVVFYTNIPEMLAEQTVLYGEKAEDLPDDLKIYYQNGDPTKPSDLHSFEKWTTTTEGITGLTITPINYQEEPIRFDASFIFIGDKNNIPWEYIALVAAAGNKPVEITSDNCIKEEDIGMVIDTVGLGSTKDVYVTRSGIDYTITMEVVATNFDKVGETSENYNNNSERATLTFLAKNIPWVRPFNSTHKTFTHPTQNIVYSGPTAGGWSMSDIRAWSNDDFLTLLDNKNSGLLAAIKEVEKISDIGMPVNTGDYKQGDTVVTFIPMTYHTYDKIWLPSTTELGTSDSDSAYNTSDQQSSMIENGTYLAYPWVSTDETRIRELNGVPNKYYTRTHKPGYTYRFMQISAEGLPDYNDTASTNSGYIFGFCI